MTTRAGERKNGEPPRARSTTGKQGLPAFFKPKVVNQNAKRWRVIRKGLAPAGDKASLRALADQAAAEHRIDRVPAWPSRKPRTF